MTGGNYLLALPLYSFGVCDEVYKLLCTLPYIQTPVLAIFVLVHKPLQFFYCTYIAVELIHDLQEPRGVGGE